MATRYEDDELKRKADLIEQTPGVAGNGMARGLRAGVNPIVAQGPTPEQLEFMKKFDPAAMKSGGAKPAAIAPVGAPAPGSPAPDPLKLKQNLDNRMKTTGLGDALVVAQNTPRPVDPALQNTREGRYISGATANPSSVGAPSVVPPAPKQKEPGFFERFLPDSPIVPKDKDFGVPPSQRSEGAVEDMVAEAAPSAAKSAVGAAATTAGRNAPGAVGTGLRALGSVARASGYAAGALGTVGAAKTAIEQTDDVSKGLRAATPENRFERLKEIGGGAMRAVGLNFDRYTPGAEQAPAAPAAAAAPTQPEMSGTVGSDQGFRAGPPAPAPAPDPEAQRQAALQAGRIQAAREAAVQGASREAGGTGISVGGLRGTPVSAGSRGPGGGGAFGSIAALGAYGAQARLQQNQAKQAAEQERIGLARSTAAEKTGLERERLGLDRQRLAQEGLRDLARLGVERRQIEGTERAARTKEVDAELADRASQIAGGPQTSGGILGIGSKTEGTDQTKARADRIRADLTSDIRHTLSKHRLGNLNDTKPETRQALYAMATIKQRVKEGREAGDRSLVEFFGVKRFDSQDLASYMPTEANTSVSPIAGGYNLRLKNGNVIKATRAANGQFNWTSANKAVDADIIDLFAPLIAKREGRR